MKTNQIMTRPMGCFSVEQRTKDGMFNATALLRQWNEQIGTSFSIEEFIDDYIPEKVRENMVRREGETIYLPLAIEPQLRLYVANYDLEVYDKLEIEQIIWSLNISESFKDDCNQSISIQNSTQKTYLMIDEISGAIKIGKAHNPIFREKTLASQIPRIRLIATKDSDIERKLHFKYKAKRMRGEWFNLSKEEIEDIISKYGFNKT